MTRRHRDVLPGDEDDVLILSANKKFIGQLIAAGIVILRRRTDHQYARLAGCLPDSPYGQPGALPVHHHCDNQFVQPDRWR